MKAPFTIYLTHHSHCDLGYTHDLPIVRELQRRFIDAALDLADRHADKGEEAAFRWTCEVTAVVGYWLQTASTRQVERLVAACQRGQFEICALWSNLTPLATFGQLVEMLSPLRRLRQELGIPVQAAMNSDVNGFSWGHGSLLRAAGITGLTMSINQHFGGALQPFPGLLQWRTPDGGNLPVWNGPTYAHTSWLGFAGDPGALMPRLREFIRRRQRAGWPHPWLLMQITHPGPQNDNMGPVAHLSPWVEDFNRRFGDEVRLAITTPSRFFAAIQSAVPTAPAVTGEWNDWWSFGVGSTPFETALFRRASAQLEEADLLGIIGLPPNHALLRAEAFDALAHYIEHTWGADSSISFPEDEDSRIQGRHKEHFAYAAYSAARLLRRDGLGALAARIDAPEGPGVVLFNPSPFERREVVPVAQRILESANLPPAADEPHPQPRRWPVDQAYQHFVDRSLFGGANRELIGPVTLPAYGWKLVTAADRAQPASILEHAGCRIGNGRVTLSWASGGGLTSIEAASRQWVAAAPVGFGTLLAEEVVSGDRKSIMRFDDSAGPVESRRAVWNPAPAVRRTPARLVATRVERDARSLTHVEDLELPFTGGASVRWTVAADHDDIEVTVSVRKLPDIRPHSLYLALPFDLPAARIWAETAGLVVDVHEEVLANGCPWWSIQGGFAASSREGTACVATPDAPMVQFRKLALGNGDIGGAALGGPGMAFLWLYNNYWETNFKADAAGAWVFRVRLAFSAQPDDMEALARTSALARHPVVAHPLPETTPAQPDWPAEGRLFSVESTHGRVEACLPEADPGQCRLVLANPNGAPDELVLRGSPHLPIGAAWLVDPEGGEIRALPVEDGALRIGLPGRGSAQVRISLAARA